jgi:hypothetical protein
VGKWNEEIKKQRAKEGWLPVLEQFHGKRIAFINIYSTEKIQEGIFYVKILWVNHESIAGGYPEDIFRSIEDCKNKRSAIIDSDARLNDLDVSKLKWRNIEGDQLQPILCESLSNL